MIYRLLSGKILIAAKESECLPLKLKSDIC